MRLLNMVNDEEPERGGREGFLRSRSVSDLGAVEGRAVGIVQARAPYPSAAIDPMIYWPFFEIDSYIRSLAGQPPRAAEPS